MDNYIIIDGTEYYCEKLWRSNKKDIKKDSNGNIFPFPKEGIQWAGMHIFLTRLKEIEDILTKNNQFKMIKPKKCLLCKKNNITDKIFLHNKILWHNGLSHYIETHNIEPSGRFKDMIFYYDVHIKKQNRNFIKLNGTIYKKFVKIDRKQLNILDALMVHGGYKKKYGDHSTKYSEHAGFLDFEGDTLKKIIVSGNTSRIEDDDDDIYFPNDLDEVREYEYIFHTHPPTPRPGGRVHDGVLYEVPSLGDIFHFIENHNDGNVVGSIVVTPEGLYCIRKLSNDPHQININDDKLYKAYYKAYNKIQEDAIDKYGTQFNDKQFFKVIAQDIEWIDKLNKTLNQFNITIDFYPRKRDINNIWYLDTIYLPFRTNKKKRSI